jgi:hypothetical protein
VINSEETGFAAPKSGVLKSSKVMVPASPKANPVHEAVLESRFLLALAASTLAGDVLRLMFIIQPPMDHPDASRASQFQSLVRYYSENVSVTRSIFGDCRGTAVRPFSQAVLLGLGTPASCGIALRQA